MNIKRTSIILLLVWSITPLAWQLYTSFCSPEALLNPFSQLENRWTLDNYTQVFSANPPFWKYLVNSTIVGLYTTIFTLILAIPAAYALA